MGENTVRPGDCCSGTFPWGAAPTTIEAMRVLRVSHSAVVDAWRERERELRALGHDVRTLSARAWDEGGRRVPL